MIYFPSLQAIQNEEPKKKCPANKKDEQLTENSKEDNQTTVPEVVSNRI